MIKLINNKKFMLVITIVISFGLIFGGPSDIFVEQAEALAIPAIPATYYIILGLLIAAGIVVTDKHAMEAFKNGVGQMYSLVKSVAEKIGIKKWNAVKEAKKIIADIEEADKNHKLPDDDPKKKPVPVLPVDQSWEWDAPKEEIEYVEVEITEEVIKDTGVMEAIADIVYDDEEFEKAKTQYQGVPFEEIRIPTMQEINAILGRDFPTDFQFVIVKQIEGHTYFGNWAGSSEGPHKTIYPGGYIMYVNTASYSINYNTGSKMGYMWHSLEYGLTHTSQGLQTLYDVLYYDEEDEEWKPLTENQLYKRYRSLSITNVSKEEGEADRLIVYSNKNIEFYNDINNIYFEGTDTGVIIDDKEIEVIRTKTYQEFLETKIPEKIPIPLDDEMVEWFMKEEQQEAYQKLLTLDGEQELTIGFYDLLTYDEEQKQTKLLTQISDKLQEIGTVDVNVQTKLTGARIPDIVILCIQVLLSCTRLAIRFLGYIVGLADVEENGELIPQEMRAGIDFLKDFELPYWNITYHELISMLASLLFAIMIIRNAKKHYF